MEFSYDDQLCDQAFNIHLCFILIVVEFYEVEM